MIVNHKRVARMMRNDNLLTIRHRELLWATGRGNEVEIYLNLASRLKVGGPDQVWIADITYHSASDGVCASGGGARSKLAV